MTNQQGSTVVLSPPRYSVLIRLQDFDNAGHRVINTIQKTVPLISVRETGQHTFDGTKSLEIIFEYIGDASLNNLKTKLALLPEVQSIYFVKIQ